MTYGLPSRHRVCLGIRPDRGKWLVLTVAGPRYGGWQTMIVDGQTHFALHQGARAKGPSTGAIAFGVDDLDKEVERLASLAIAPTDTEVTDTGIARFTTFQDPDGNDVQLLER